MLWVAISVFSLFHPRQLVVTTASPAATQVITLGESKLPFTTSGEWTLAVPGKIERRFRGRLEIRANGDELTAVVHMDLETAVASVVAAESVPGAPLEALRAQAVAARSFLVAAKDRHRGFDFCDTTHCQFLREPPAAGSEAGRAAETTRGLTLQFHGRTIAALYSADCGGRTDGSVTSGYVYVPVDCPRSGPRRGHGLGLCQEGAAVMAKSGASFLQILNHYYPGTSVRAISSHSSFNELPGLPRQNRGAFGNKSFGHRDFEYSSWSRGRGPKTSIYDNKSRAAIHRSEPMLRWAGDSRHFRFARVSAIAGMGPGSCALDRASASSARRTGGQGFHGLSHPHAGAERAVYRASLDCL